MNTYEVSLKSGHKRSVPGKTPSKAKYEYYLDVADLFENFAGFLKCVASCKKLHKFRASDLLGDKEQFDRMKGMRGIEFAFQGMKIEVCGKPGTIVGSNSSLNLDVVFEGQYHANNCHPWHETKYFDCQGNVIADYTKEVKTG